MANQKTPRKKGTRNPDNIKRDKRGQFAPTAPKHKKPPQARTGNRQGPTSVPNPHTHTQQAGNSFSDDAINATITKERKRFTANQKLNDRRLMLRRTSKMKTQTENLKKVLLEAKNGNDAQRVVVEKILSQLFQKNVSIDWNS